MLPGKCQDIQQPEARARYLQSQHQGDPEGRRAAWSQGQGRRWQGRQRLGASWPRTWVYQALASMGHSVSEPALGIQHASKTMHVQCPGIKHQVLMKAIAKSGQKFAAAPASTCPLGDRAHPLLCRDNGWSRCLHGVSLNLWWSGCQNVYIQM